MLVWRACFNGLGSYYEIANKWPLPKIIDANILIVLKEKLEKKAMESVKNGR